jgi:lipoate-protein ligase A
LRETFRLVGQALMGALTSLGVPYARLRPVRGEYCDGAWSVKVAGGAKVAGTGQRLYRHGFLLCRRRDAYRP